MYYKINLPGPVYFEQMRRLRNPVSYWLDWLFAKTLGLTSPLVYRYVTFPDLPPFGSVELPGALKKRVRDLLAESQEHPLTLTFSYGVPLRNLGRVSYGSALLALDGRACVVLVFSADAWPDTTVTCLSRLREGRTLITTDEPNHAVWIGKHANLAVEGVAKENYFAEEVVARHYERLGPLGEEVSRIASGSLPAFLADTVQAINDSWEWPGR